MNRIFAMVAAGVLLSAPMARAEVALLDEDTAVKVTRGRRPALANLNRQTFAGNVLREGGFAENWVVLFCVDWYPPCQALQMPFEGSAERQSKAYNNNSLLHDFVKFATVDCAVDKVLCNEQGVETYPWVSHYHMGEVLARWTGGSEARDAKSFSKWLEKELANFKAWSLETPPLLSQRERAAVMRMLAAIAASVSFFIWAVGRGMDIWLAWSMHRESRKPAPKPETAPTQPGSADDGAAPSGRAPLTWAQRRLPQEWASDRGSMEL